MITPAHIVSEWYFPTKVTTNDFQLIQKCESPLRRVILLVLSVILSYCIVIINRNRARPRISRDSCIMPTPKTTDKAEVNIIAVPTACWLFLKRAFLFNSYYPSVINMKASLGLSGPCFGDWIDSDEGLLRWRLVSIWIKRKTKRQAVQIKDKLALYSPMQDASMLFSRDWFDAQG